MKRFHIALSVKDIPSSVKEYSQRLGCKPSVVVKGKYALWRTKALNFSIRKATPAGKLRHLGWEDSLAPRFTKSADINGITWERFTRKQQLHEIRLL